MAVTIEKDLKNIKRLIPKVRVDYSRRLRRPLKRAITKDILRGISPVLGEGKFQKYSASYKDQIRGKALFFTLSNGRVVVVKGPKNSLPTIPNILGKRLSPVNLKLSGQMLSSLRVRAIGSITNRKLEIIFEDGVAVFHNNLGAGKSRVKRRLLPTENNENFNRKITNLTVTVLEQSVAAIIKKFN